jgi:hypothetical protein
MSLHARPNMRPDSKRHTLRALVALVREMPPPQPPRKARTKLKNPHPRGRRLVQPTRLSQCRSYGICGTPIRRVRKESVKRSAPTEAYPPFAAMYLEGATTATTTHRMCTSNQVKMLASPETLLCLPQFIARTRVISVPKTSTPVQSRLEANAVQSRKGTKQ